MFQKFVHLLLLASPSLASTTTTTTAGAVASAVAGAATGSNSTNSSSVPEVCICPPPLEILAHSQLVTPTGATYTESEWEEHYFLTAIKTGAYYSVTTLGEECACPMTGKQSFPPVVLSSHDAVIAEVKNANSVLDESLLLYSTLAKYFNCEDDGASQCGSAQLTQREAFGTHNKMECAKAVFYQEESDDGSIPEIDLDTSVCIEDNWCGTKVTIGDSYFSLTCPEPGFFVEYKNFYRALMIVGGIIVLQCICIKLTGGMGSAISKMKGEDNVTILSTSKEGGEAEPEQEGGEEEEEEHQETERDERKVTINIEMSQRNS